MGTPHVLVVEDEEDILELVEFNLKKEGFRATCCPSGEDGLAAIKKNKPDIVVLDLMLPGINGLEVCKALKNNPDTRDILVLMLTAKGEESDVVVGLELGADDYVTKPFSPRVLMARLRALLRRREHDAEPQVDTRAERILKLHELEVHPGRRETLVRGKPVELTTTEFDLLHFLARRPGWVFTRQQILDAVRGYDAVVTDRAVDVQVVGLRKKLGRAGKYIETVRGVGYRFKE